MKRVLYIFAILALVSSCKKTDVVSQTTNNFSVVEDATIYQVNTPLTEEQQKALFSIIGSESLGTRSYPVEDITSEDNLYLKSMANTYIVMFGASWSGPSQLSLTHFTNCAAEHPIGLKFAYCDVRECEEIARTFGINMIPTTIVIRDMLVMETIVGALTPDILEGLVSRHIDN